jgi:ureidoglycolate dehydrogenase (NAD+)
MAGQIVIAAEPLRAFTREMFRKAGLAEEQAAVTADVLIWAELRGHPSHGVWRIPLYTGWIGSGIINAGARPKVVLRKGAVAKLDGEGAVGPAAMAPATETAIAQAREHAAAWVLVQDHTHAGAIGFYAERVAAAGMAAIVMSALRPMMAYHGTRGAAVSTNPIAIAMPGGIMLDMSTSASSRGKLTVAKAMGKPLPSGIALDKDGHPTTDPNAAATLTPMAGPKGAGLSLMIEALTSVAAGQSARLDRAQRPQADESHPPEQPDRGDGRGRAGRHDGPEAQPRLAGTVHQGGAARRGLRRDPDARRTGRARIRETHARRNPHRRENLAGGQ